MINIEEELKKYRPLPALKDVEESIRDKDLMDLIDIMKKMTEYRDGSAGDMTR